MTMILSNLKTIRPQCDVKSLLVKERSKKFIVHSDPLRGLSVYIKMTTVKERNII